jgi:hypothetical protein
MVNKEIKISADHNLCWHFFFHIIGEKTTVLLLAIFLISDTPAEMICFPNVTLQ